MPITIDDRSDFDKFFDSLPEAKLYTEAEMQKAVEDENMRILTAIADYFTRDTIFTFTAEDLAEAIRARTGD